MDPINIHPSHVSTSTSRIFLWDSYLWRFPEVNPSKSFLTLIELPKKAAAEKASSYGGPPGNGGWKSVMKIGDVFLGDESLYSG